jgi:phage gpG-like protein
LTAQRKYTKNVWGGHHNDPHALTDTASDIGTAAELEVIALMCRLLSHCKYKVFLWTLIKTTKNFSIMNANEIRRRIERAEADIEKEVSDRLPREVGVTAVNFFRQNFRDAGWRDNGLHPWKKTLRQQGKGTDAEYKPLTSRRDHLMRSIQYEKTAPGEVTITDPVPYAAIHNEGGTINTHPSVTSKMRRFAWAKAYSLAGIKGKGRLPKELPPEAAKWRALALTKKSRLNITAHIPKRQFMGESHELMQKINNIINQSLNRIRNGILGL